MRWVVVVPVKPAAEGKTRLAGALSAASRARLVRAMALDTVGAAEAAAGVLRVVVVTADTELRALLGASVDLVDEPGGGLNAAVGAGIARARSLGTGVAVLLGDLPALRPADLADALDLASAHDRAMVADAEGTGTTLLTALPGLSIDPRFGAGSAAAHEHDGHVRLAVPPTSTLRRDVDVPDDLVEVERLGVGPATRAALDQA
ncbi:2-phospho-L-lactate guanylyltransferase [Cellulomonas fengjieae]|uniref:2-phospho-L-lactate guanylyltransferase n=1 Tax=Cellulomonas fengjieae TaxID=2819978 RepID=UPI0020BFDDC2|nr:2-phospho-L-lactate guanylyltransferase [Cellulomonas fengjieae]